MIEKMKRLEVLAWIATLLGLAAKLSLMAWGNYALILGLVILATLNFLAAYQPPTVKEIQQRSDPPEFFADALAPKLIKIAGALVILGILFKLMLWRASRATLTPSTLIEVVVLFTLAVKGRFNIRAALFGALGVLMIFVSPKYLTALFHRDDPVLVEKMNYQIDHPRDTAAATAVRRYLAQQQSSR